ncbi:hypothetical protein M1N64_00055 [Peptococcaceae bacterium]|nr:hypothetical protein [Peptococcaceae bacterium]
MGTRRNVPINPFYFQVVMSINQDINIPRQHKDIALRSMSAMFKTIPASLASDRNSKAIAGKRYYISFF